jgi:hypothetical protein
VGGTEVRARTKVWTNPDDPDETKTYYEINPDLIDDVTDPENHKLFFQGRD